MTYESSIQVEGEKHSVASLSPPSVAEEQKSALQAYLDRSEEVRTLYKNTVASGKSVTFVPGDGLYIKSITYGVGGTKQYIKIADWTAEGTEKSATSFEARRVPHQAASFEASVVPRTVTVTGEARATSQKTAFIAGVVCDSARAETSKIHCVNNGLIRKSLLSVDSTIGESPYKNLLKHFEKLQGEESPKEIATKFLHKHPEDTHGRAFLEEIQRNEAGLLADRSNIGIIAEELIEFDITKWLQEHM